MIFFGISRVDKYLRAGVEWSPSNKLNCLLSNMFIVFPLYPYNFCNCKMKSTPYHFVTIYTKQMRQITGLITGNNYYILLAGNVGKPNSNNILS